MTAKPGLCCFPCTHLVIELAKPIALCVWVEYSVLSLDALQSQEGQGCALMRPQGLRVAIQGPGRAREQLQEVKRAWVRSHHCSSRSAVARPRCSSAVGTAVTDAAHAGAAVLTGGKLGTKEKPPADAVQVILGSVLQHVQGTLPVLQGKGEIRGSCASYLKGLKLFSWQEPFLAPN